MLVRLDAHFERREALVACLHVGTDLASIVKERTRLANRPVGCSKPLFLEECFHIIVEQLFGSQTGVEFLLVLQHDPLGILLTGVERFGRPVGTRNECHRRYCQQAGEHDEADTESSKREAVDGPRMHKHGNTGQRKCKGKQSRKHSKGGFRRPCAFNLRRVGIHLHERLVCSR